MNIYLEETVKDEPNSGFVNIIYRSAQEQNIIK